MYTKILVPLDGSELAECVLPQVETITAGCGVKTVEFVRVAEPVEVYANEFGPVLTGDQWEQFEDQRISAAEQYLSQLAQQVSLKGTQIKTTVLTGRVADTLAEYADKNNFDLIVIATHGRSGISRWVWGSVAERILHSACVPVLMVRVPGCPTGT